MWVLLAIAAAYAGADDVLGASALGAGSAVVAATHDNASITVNPGGLALTERYDLFAHGALGPWPDYALAASVVDARTSVVALGLSYRFRRADPTYTDADLPGWTLPGELPTNRRVAHDVGVGVGAQLLDRKLGIGIGGTLAVQQHARTGTRTSGNVDVGLAAHPVDAFSVGLVGRNLVPFDPLSTHPLSVLFGARGIAKELGFIEVDVGWQRPVAGESPLVLRAGAELIRGDGQVRLGVDHTTGATHLSIGGGFDSESASLDYTLLVPLGGPLRFGDTIHVLGIRVRT